MHKLPLFLPESRESSPVPEVLAANSVTAEGQNTRTLRSLGRDESFDFGPAILLVNPAKEGVTTRRSKGP